MSRKEDLRNIYSFSNNSTEDFDCIGLDSESEKYIEKFVSSKESYIQNYKASISYYEEIDEHEFSLEAIVGSIEFENEILNSLESLRISDNENARQLYSDITKCMGVEVFSNKMKKESLGSKIGKLLKEMFIKLKNMISNVIAAFKKLFRNITARGDRRIALIIERKGEILQSLKKPDIKNITIRLARAYKPNKFLACEQTFLTNGFKEFRKTLTEANKHIQHVINSEKSFISSPIFKQAISTIGTAVIADQFTTRATQKLAFELGSKTAFDISNRVKNQKLKDEFDKVGRNFYYKAYGKLGNNINLGSIGRFIGAFGVLKPFMDFLTNHNRLRGGMLKSITGRVSGAGLAKSLLYNSTEPHSQNVYVSGIINSVPFEVLSNNYISDLEASCDTLQYLVVNCNSSLDLLNKTAEGNQKLYKRTHKALSKLRIDMQTISSLSRELLKEGLYIRQAMIKACYTVLNKKFNSKDSDVGDIGYESFEVESKISKLKRFPSGAKYDTSYENEISYYSGKSLEELSTEMVWNFNELNSMNLAFDRSYETYLYNKPSVYKSLERMSYGMEGFGEKIKNFFKTVFEKLKELYLKMIAFFRKIFKKNQKQDSKGKFAKFKEFINKNKVAIAGGVAITAFGAAAVMKKTGHLQKIVSNLASVFPKVTKMLKDLAGKIKKRDFSSVKGFKEKIFSLFKSATGGEVDVTESKNPGAEIVYGTPEPEEIKVKPEVVAKTVDSEVMDSNSTVWKSVEEIEKENKEILRVIDSISSELENFDVKDSEYKETANALKECNQCLQLTGKISSGIVKSLNEVKTDTEKVMKESGVSSNSDGVFSLLEKAKRKTVKCKVFNISFDAETIGKYKNFYIALYNERVEIKRKLEDSNIDIEKKIYKARKKNNSIVSEFSEITSFDEYSKVTNILFILPGKENEDGNVYLRKICDLYDRELRIGSDGGVGILTKIDFYDEKINKTIKKNNK